MNPRDYSRGGGLVGEDAVALRVGVGTEAEDEFAGVALLVSGAMHSSSIKVGQPAVLLVLLEARQEGQIRPTCGEGRGVVLGSLVAVDPSRYAFRWSGTSSFEISEFICWVPPLAHAQEAIALKVFCPPSTRLAISVRFTTAPSCSIKKRRPTSARLKKVYSGLIHLF